MFEQILSRLPPLVASGASTIAVILGVMAAIALVEVVIPLHRRNRWNSRHLGPNLGLTFITFATNLFFNAAIVLSLLWLQTQGLGLFNSLHVPILAETIIVVVALDFSFYIAHVLMHALPTFWRVHGVHHSDPAVDVTTTIRQHPLEGLIRYAFVALAAFPLGASPAAFAIYRTLSAIGGLLEHANIALPHWLSSTLSWITTWPDMHKVHHSSDRLLTDTNYGNLLSLWDRLFGTFTPAQHGREVTYGLVGTDTPEHQKISVLLTQPFDASTRPNRPGASSHVEAPT